MARVRKSVPIERLKADGASKREISRVKKNINSRSSRELSKDGPKAGRKPKKK